MPKAMWRKRPLFRATALPQSEPVTQGANAHSRWILLPGTLCTTEVFEPVLDHLGVEKGRRVPFPVDSASLPELGARLDDLVAPGDIVCGFSLGSLVLAQNLDALGKAKAVVLLSLNPLSDAPENAAMRRAVRDRILAGDAAGWVNDNWKFMSTSMGTEPRKTVVNMAQKTAQMIGPQTELAIARPDATNSLVSTDMPLVFVTGAEDPMTPPGPVEKIAGKAQRGTARILPGLGHFGLLEEPARVAAAIADGLEESLDGCLK